jgi:uncharacterized protein involved in response to NO
MLWHAHEMIYGFTMSVIAGFLLTAVANWTGWSPVRNLHLLGLVILWLSGRLLMSLDLGAPKVFVMAVELGFIPALAISLLVPLLKASNIRNLVFIGILLGLWLIDAWVLFTENIDPLILAIFLIMLIISVIAGRIIPSFVVAGLRRSGLKVYQKDQRITDTGAALSLVALSIAVLMQHGDGWVMVTAAIACLLHAARMRHYYVMRSFSDPMLWILQLGYAWLVLGLALLAFSAAGWFGRQAALHAITVGSIGSLCLGMMVRVALAHTGRSLRVPAHIVATFVAMQIATVIRVMGSMGILAPTFTWMQITAVLWSLCFCIYFLQYAYILLTPGPAEN